MVVYSGLQWFTLNHYERRHAMASPSMAQSALTAIQAISELGLALNDDDRAIREPAVRQLYQQLGRLEEVARRRVDTSTYEAFRRSLEVCHITPELPSARRG